MGVDAVICRRCTHGFWRPREVVRVVVCAAVRVRWELDGAAVKVRPDYVKCRRESPACFGDSAVKSGGSSC